MGRGRRRRAVSARVAASSAASDATYTLPSIRTHAHPHTVSQSARQTGPTDQLPRAQRQVPTPVFTPPPTYTPHAATQSALVRTIR
eukprot:3220557-Rhodomonas_salina.1